jgi:hypothetical protein
LTEITSISFLGFGLLKKREVMNILIACKNDLPLFLHGQTYEQGGKRPFML